MVSTQLIATRVLPVVVVLSVAISAFWLLSEPTSMMTLTTSLYEEDTSSSSSDASSTSTVTTAETAETTPNTTIIESSLSADRNDSRTFLERALEELLAPMLDDMQQQPNDDPSAIQQKNQVLAGRLHQIPNEDVIESDEGTTKDKADEENEKELDPIELRWQLAPMDPFYDEECAEQTDYDFVVSMRSRVSDPCNGRNINTSMTCYRHPRDYHAMRESFCKASGIGFGLFPNSTIPRWGLACNRRVYHHGWKVFAQKTGLGYYFRWLNSTMPKVSCAAWSDTPVIFIKRDSAANIFHWAAQYVAYLITLEVLGWTPTSGYITDEFRKRNPLMDDVNALIDPKYVRKHDVVILDYATDGPYWKLWGTYMPNGRETPYRNAEYLNRFINLSQQPASYLCLKEGVFGLPGGSSILWNNDWVPTRCRESKMLQMFSKRITYALGIPDYVGHFVMSNTIKMVFVSRKLRGLRSIENEQMVIDALLAKYNGTDVNVEVVTFETMPFVDQVKLIKTTDVLVGVHGAGLTHLLWMPYEGAIVEIVPRFYAPQMFRNMAKWTNKYYFSWHVGKEKNKTEMVTVLNIDGLLATVEAAVLESPSDLLESSDPL